MYIQCTKLILIVSHVRMMHLHREQLFDLLTAPRWWWIENGAFYLFIIQVNDGTWQVADTMMGSIGNSAFYLSYIAYLSFPSWTSTEVDCVSLLWRFSIRSSRVHSSIRIEPTDSFKRHFLCCFACRQFALFLPRTSLWIVKRGRPKYRRSAALFLLLVSSINWNAPFFVCCLLSFEPAERLSWSQMKLTRRGERSDSLSCFVCLCFGGGAAALNAICVWWTRIYLRWNHRPIRPIRYHFASSPPSVSFSFPCSSPFSRTERNRTAATTQQRATKCKRTSNSAYKIFSA